MSYWVYDPHSGGTKISTRDREEICKQAEAYARTRPWYPRIQLKLRFKNQFCYVDTIESGDDRLSRLCRLRNLYSGWSLALFTYSNELYQPCMFPEEKSVGTFEAALNLCEDFIV